MQTITSIDDAVALVGHELGVSGWKEIDQQRINDFADVTEDRQWIHTDVERAQWLRRLSASVSQQHVPAHNRDRHVLHLRRRHRGRCRRSADRSNADLLQPGQHLGRVGVDAVGA